MRRLRLVLVLVAATATLAVAAATAAAAPDFGPNVDVAVTGILDDQTTFSGTLQINRFISTQPPAIGIQVEIAGVVTGKTPVTVADKQLVPLENVAVDADPTTGMLVALGDIETTSGGTLSLDPIKLSADELPPSANGLLKALSHAEGPPGVHYGEIAALLNAIFRDWGR